MTSPRVDDATAGLQHAAGFLRSELAQRMKLRIVPQLQFEYDESVERGMRLSQLIDEAVADDAARATRDRPLPEEEMSGVRAERRAVDGVLLLDKPSGITSHTAVQTVRRLFNAAKAGHTGTLDPLATGLLPVCLGEATKFSHLLLDADKTYLASIRLGITTNTGDLEGEVTARFPVKVEPAEDRGRC